MRARRVVLAEDHVDTRALLAEVLVGRGYLVGEFADWPGLIAAAAAWGPRGGGGEAPDLVVVDLRMPGGSGLRGLAALRGAAPDVPVLVITAFGDPDTHLRARQMGVCLVLDKPFEAREFLDAVEVFARKADT